MTAVLLGLLKGLGILLLALLALAVALLCVPAAVGLRYERGELAVKACYGPLRLTLYPRPRAPAGGKKGGADGTKGGKEDGAKKTGQGARARPAPAAGGAAASSGAPVKSRRPARPHPAAGAKAAASTPTPSKAPAPPGRLEALLDTARSDPMAFLQAALGHVAFAGGRLLRGIHVRRLRVFWTVTVPQDAAATALRYGRQMALLNNLLARARQHMDIRADSLRLEPDFTGELAAQRAMSCQIALRPIIIVALAPRLLLRVWRDPMFKALFARR